MATNNGGRGPIEHLARIAQLEAEIAGLVNMLTVMVRRDGGRAVITPRQLSDIDNCKLTAATQADKSVVLTVVRMAAVGP